MGIKQIKLENMLPRVFVNETIPPSEVWRKNLCFNRGENYLIEAASGGGKSSLCAFIYGSRTDFEGELFFDDKNSSYISISEWQTIRQTSIAYLPQELSLFPELSALDNIRLKNSLTGYASDKQIEEWMEEIGIAFRADYPVGRMSIGQQQRVAIIRAICQPFDFILLDEPVSHLDEENNGIAATIIQREASRQGASIISTSVGNPILLSSAKNLSL